MYSKETWKSEITSLLSHSPIYRRLHNLSLEDEGANQLKVLVIEGVDYAIQRSKLIIDSMKEYTLHDVDHLTRVLQHMGRLIPEKTLNNLNSLELGLLILSAFFHDLGMAPSGKEVEIYRGLIKDEDLSEEEKKLKEEFYLYCKSNPEMEEKINRLNKTGLHSQAQVIENYRLTEFIRRTHAKRIKSVVKEDWIERLKYKDFDFTTCLISICESHNESLVDTKLPGIETSILVAEKEYVNSLFIAIVLRLSDLLDFDAKRTPDVLYNHMVIESPVSIREWKKHRTIEAWDINSNRIVFRGKCSHPAIEKSIRTFCDYINFELITCQNLLIRMNDHFRENLKDIYFIPLPNSVNTDQVEPEIDLDNMKPKYYYKDLQFQLDQNHIMNLLMGTKLYSNSSVAVRELLQNSIDACNFRKMMAENWGSSYVPEINISLIRRDKNSYLEIEDNGIGMNEEIINNYFTKIGKSYYKSEDFHRTLALINRNYNPISRFGIGILSVFMISDTVSIETMRLIDEYETDEPINLRLEGIDAFFWYKKGNRKRPGTKIILKLKENNNLQEFETTDDLKNYISDLINPNYLSPIIKVNGEEIQNINTDIEEWSDDYQEIEFYNIKIDTNDGIEGGIVVALLKEDDKHVYEVIHRESDVIVEDEGFTLTDKFTLARNAIQQVSDSIVYDNGYADISSSYSSIMNTAGKIFVNGIRVEENIFRPNSVIFGESKTEGVDLPFALYYELNISGETDLNLTAARDKIIKDSLWHHFKERLIDLILTGIIDAVGEYDQCRNLSKAFKETFIDESILEKYEFILSKKFPQ
ncbi:ATP-binding protein (plasmid) [Bacillus sp. JZ8]